MPTSAYNEGTRSWYGLYQKQKEYAQIDKLKESQVKSGMIYGSMYDAVMNWALYGTDKADANKVTASSTKHGPGKTGALDSDVIKNIYDLGNNLYECTAEAYSTNIRVLRGGVYGYTHSPSSRSSSSNNPSVTYSDRGSRFLLYL